MSPPKDIAMSACFGANDHLPCPKCKNYMSLTRRAPHAIRGSGFELQTFTCSVCEHEIQRNADRQGEVA